MKTSTWQKMCAGLAVLALVGCGNAGLDSSEYEVSAPSDGVTSSSEAIVNGTLLETLDFGGGHKLEFYEFEHGQTGVHETQSIENARSLLKGIAGGSTLADVYRALKPEAEVPVALANADARSLEFVDLIPEANESQLLPVAAEQESNDENMIQKSCSADFFGDNYGEQWFLDNFCNEGAFRVCDGNVPSKFFDKQSSSWLKWEVMAADFAVGASVRGGHYYKYCDCPWGCSLCASTERFKWDFSFPIQPRRIDGWMWTTQGKRYVSGTGDAACPKIHFALEKN
jgi:hypothetical protein